MYVCAAARKWIFHNTYTGTTDHSFIGTQAQARPRPEMYCDGSELMKIALPNNITAVMYFVW